MNFVLDKLKSNHYFKIVINIPITDFHTRKLHMYRVSFLNTRYDCRNVIVSAYSKRHAKKLARKICRITEWLGVEKNG